MDRVLHIDKRPLSKTAVYVLSPCLLFSLIVGSTVDPVRFAQMIGYSLATIVAMIASGSARADTRLRESARVRRIAVIFFMGLPPYFCYTQIVMGTPHGRNRRRVAAVPARGVPEGLTL